MPPSEGRLREPDLRRLLEAGRGLVAELDLESVLQRVLGTARDLTNARYAALGILDDRKEELERFLFVGISEEGRRAIGPLPRGRGVLGELIREPRTLRLPDVTEHPRSYGFPAGHPPMTTFLGVPIMIRGEAFGNLYLTDKAGGEEFDAGDEESVLVLAEWAAIAIDNARLYTSLEDRRHELERAVRGLEATATVARAVGFETDLERVLELIVERGRALVDARSLVVLLDQGGTMRVTAAAGEVGAAAVGTTVPLEGSLVGAVLASGAPERVADLHARVGHGLARVSGDARAAVVVPLGFRGRGRGVLVAFDRASFDTAFDADDEHVLTSFAASAAIAIATAQSVETDRLRHSLRASEQERGRWARELHDETLQELGALKMLLESASRTAKPEVLREAVDKTLEQIDLSIRNLQGLIAELRPAALDELGLWPALDALLVRTAATSGLDIEQGVELAEGTGHSAARLAPDVESTIYRLVQEALTNAAKHADCERARVAIVERAGTVVVTVSDDGRGFDPERPYDGFGLTGMQERVALLGGRLEIESEVGVGTTIRAELPARLADALAASAHAG